MTPTITLAGLDDVADIVRLLDKQFVEHDIPPPDMVVAVRGMLEIPGRGSIFLARLGDRAVGLAVLAFTWTVEHGGFTAWLDELFVEPELRSHGVGRAMLLVVIEHARSKGAAAIDLEVVEGHERAARLYQREGFRAHKRARWVLPL